MKAKLIYIGMKIKCFENHQYPIFNFGTIFKIKACKSESNDVKGTKIAQPKWLSGHYSDKKAF